MRIEFGGGGRGDWKAGEMEQIEGGKGKAWGSKNRKWMEENGQGQSKIVKGR